MTILGVCNKLSEKSNIDRGLIQFSFIIGTIITGGTAILIYLLAHLLID